jgi:pyrroline-5-carboxylate reductase
LENIKIGIIGGGVMGRLFLNNLLILQKIGVDPVNITVSTRQEEDMEIYKTLFKVNIAFDNEKLAEESDILIITTPATLDNWIVVDLR